MSSREEYNGINLRLSNPSKYYMAMTFAIMCVLLGFNFLLTEPTFNPLTIPKEITGSIFLFLGFAKLILLNIWRRLDLLRFIMSGAVFWLFIWGGGTTITFFMGKSSLQLPIVYAALIIAHLLLLTEPFYNPITAADNPIGTSNGK